MIAKSFQTGVLACSILAAGFGVVQAEPTVSGADNEVQEETADPSSTRSPEVMLSEGRMTVDRMEASADNIGRMLRGAREDKDVVKVVCLDDKLNQMNVAARSAADRFSSLETAVESGNMERARHEDAVLAALASRASDLGDEANQCIGEEKGALGDTVLEIKIDPAIPTANTTDPGVTVVISAPPVAASPTL